VNTQPTAAPSIVGRRVPIVKRVIQTVCLVVLLLLGALYLFGGQAWHTSGALMGIVVAVSVVNGIVMWLPARRNKIDI
jgi:hypothetical protein